MSVNDAPAVDCEASAEAVIIEDEYYTASVSTLLSDFALQDVDNGALGGIAIVNAVGSGSWEYSCSTFPGCDLSSSNPLLLGDECVLRYLPDGNNGETASFSIHAWDQTVGKTGGTWNIEETGGATAFSGCQKIVTIYVDPINDAPIMDCSGGKVLTIGPITEDEPSEPTLVSSLSSVADVDIGTLGGIAITQTTGGGGGTWQYQPSDEPS